MEKTYRNFINGSKINTLEESLKLFDKSCLLEQLDINLELVRRNKETKQQHLCLLKSADKDLLKLSQIHHPDKAIREKKSDQEVVNAQNLQTALNATRSVLKALTEVFLKDIDVHYKYEFFAKLDINTLINEKQIDLEINNVLCKISRLSEVKRVNIIGEIRKFLQESRESLSNFLRGRNHDFVRHRNHAIRHLHKCIEGYKILATECNLIVDECIVDNDKNTRGAIEKIFEESLRESEFLQNLGIVAKRSLDGNFEIFPTFRFREYYFMNIVKYEPLEPKEKEYFVSPFILYVNVLLMCSVMVDKKSRGIKLVTKIEEIWGYCFGDYTEEYINYIKEPVLLKAYQLVSYFINKNNYKRQVQSILINRFHCVTENNIRQAFKETVKEIEQILGKQFDINSYKEGKSNREQFNERLFELNNSMAEFQEVENNLLEKIKLYEKETNEIRKEYLELFGKNEETDQECRENISKYENSRENVETESVQNIDELEKIVQKNIKENNKFPENTNQTTQNADDLHDFIKENDESSKMQAEEASCCNKDQKHKESLSSQLLEHIFNDPGKANKDQQNIKANSTSTESTFSNETAEHTTQKANEQCHDFSKEHDESVNAYAEETPCSIRDPLHKESFSGQLNERVSNEAGETDKDQQNIKANNTSPESISSSKTANQTARMSNEQCHDFLKEHEKCSKGHAEETPCSNRDQLHKESLDGPLQECDFKGPGDTDKDQPNIKSNNTSPENIFGIKTSNQTAQMANDLYNDFPQKHDECPKMHAEESPCFNRDQPLKEYLSGELLEHVSNEQGVTDKDQQDIKANIAAPESISDNETINQTTQTANDQSHDFHKEHDECENGLAEKTPCSSRDQQNSSRENEDEKTDETLKMIRRRYDENSVLESWDESKDEWIFL